MLAYLCGPIEFAPDGGKTWRRTLTPFLREQLGHSVYDPAEDERKNLTEEEVANFRQWKSSNRALFRNVLRKIIQFDLDLIENRADYLICHWDASAVASGGTSGEITVAYRRGIPVYLVTPQPVEQISGWILGCVDRVFASVETLMKFLAERYGEKKHKEFSAGT